MTDPLRNLPPDVASQVRDQVAEYQASSEDSVQLKWRKRSVKDRLLEEGDRRKVAQHSLLQTE